MLSELMDFLSERGIEFKTDVPMSKYTTFRIGGNADIMIFPRTVQDVSLIVAELKRENIRRITVGNGSNLLVDDDGIRGAVIKTSLIDFVRVNGCEITAGAGCLNSKVANAALDASLTGMEFAHGIPGSIGGAVFMNAGAYSGTFADIVAEGRNIEKQDFEFVVEFYSECAIGFISYWLDMGMQFPREIVEEKILRVMDNSVENLMERFQTK